MKTSTTVAQLFEALAKAQAEFPSIPKSRTAKIKTRTGADFEYKYADLSDILTATSKILSKHGLSVTQGPTIMDSRFLLVTTVGHSPSGEFISYFYPIHENADPRADGSEQTYKRRYALSAAIGVQSEDDDDGAGAAIAESPQRKSAKIRQPEPVALPSTKTEQNPRCRVCNAEMRISKNKQNYFCPNFQDQSNGEHTIFRVSGLQKYLEDRANEQSEPVEDKYPDIKL